MVKITKLIQDLPHSPTLWVNDLVGKKRAQGEDVYQMGFGESPFPVPERLQKALAEAAHHCTYLPAQGLPELIEAVQAYYRPFLGDSIIDSTDVIIASGSKPILYALQMAIEGDLLMPVPSWVSYAPQAHMLNTNVIKVLARLDNDGYHIDPQYLRECIVQARNEGKNPRKIILNTPNNPTGLMIPEAELEAIAAVCREENILIISDEIYGLLSFDGCYSTIAKYAPERTVVTTALSKQLSLGGWRLGIGFVPRSIDGLYPALRNIMSEMWSCTAAPIQYACIQAYEGHEDIESHIQSCVEIHKFMSLSIAEGLLDAGIQCSVPQGGFYSYPDFSSFKDELAALDMHTSQDIHQHLLREYNLATLPGSAFGAEPEVLTLRLSGCDYDGTRALQAYQDGEKLDQDFVAKHAPNIISALAVFDEFIATIKK